MKVTTACHLPNWQSDYEPLPYHEAARTMPGWSDFQMVAGPTVWDLNTHLRRCGHLPASLCEDIARIRPLRSLFVDAETLLAIGTITTRESLV